MKKVDSSNAKVKRGAYHRARVWQQVPHYVGAMLDLAQFEPEKRDRGKRLPVFDVWLWFRGCVPRRIGMGYDVERWTEMAKSRLEAEIKERWGCDIMKARNNAWVRLQLRDGTVITTIAW